MFIKLIIRISRDMSSDGWLVSRLLLGVCLLVVK